jgi:acyl-CoA thioesterase-1
VHGPSARRRVWRSAPAAGGALALAAILAAAGACGGAAPTQPGATPSGAPTLSGATVSPSATPGPSGRALRYVALGDSYTIGTSVNEPERWPDQLVRALAGDPARLEIVGNLAVNGFTTADVIAVELPQLEALAPEFVTLQIGVNDVVQGVPEATYRERLGEVLTAIRARVPATRILVVTTPDYTVTPAGADYGDPTTKRAAIRRFNQILVQGARSLGITVVDIFDLSQAAATDGTLVARDGLHPSGRQYGAWVGRIAPAARSLLGPPSSSAPPSP